MILLVTSLIWSWYDLRYAVELVFLPFFRWFKYITEAADSQKKSSSSTIKRVPPVYKAKLTLSEEEAASQSGPDLKAEDEQQDKLSTNKYVSLAISHHPPATYGRQLPGIGVQLPICMALSA